MIRSALLAAGFVAAVATTATAQTYYYPYAGNPYYNYSGTVYPPYSYPYASSYNYPYGYSAYYGWPYGGYYYPNRTPPSYADPFVYARPYSDGAGPAPN
jgi:hypothetical protein